MEEGLEGEGRKRLPPGGVAGWPQVPSLAPGFPLVVCVQGVRAVQRRKCEEGSLGHSHQKQGGRGCMTSGYPIPWGDVCSTRAGGAQGTAQPCVVFWVGNVHLNLLRCGQIFSGQKDEELCHGELSSHYTNTFPKTHTHTALYVSIHIDGCV